MAEGKGLAEPPTSPGPSDSKSTDSKHNPLGTLKASVWYDDQSHQLHVHLLSGHDLPAKDMNGFSDPYCKLYLLPDPEKKSKKKTKVIKKNLNPVWDQGFVYDVEKADLKTRTLELSVWDWDRGASNDYIGCVIFERLHKVTSKRPEPRAYRITDRVHDKHHVNPGEMKGDPRLGWIKAGIWYDEKEEILHVDVLKCRDLPARDSNHLSDPFIKLYVTPDPEKKTKHKTKVVQKTLTPEFNESFTFNVRRDERREKSLEMSLWDWDRGSMNDYIGVVLIKCHRIPTQKEAPQYYRVEPRTTQEMEAVANAFMNQF